MLDIKIIYDSRNYTIIKDLKTDYVWLYSFQKPIAYYNKNKIRISNSDLTQTDKFHLKNFKKVLDNMKQE
jgi:hypothetical protein